VKTCDLVEEDKARGIRKYAKPIGVIADVVPCTNPESTICCIGLSTLKTRNAMIVSPHPRTQKSSYLTVEYGREALKKIGAPVDLLQCIKNTSQEKTQQLMSHCDFAVATGGAALVKVVYAAGKPAQTVGPETWSPSWMRRFRPPGDRPQDHAFQNRQQRRILLLGKRRCPAREHLRQDDRVPQERGRLSVQHGRARKRCASACGRTARP